MRAIVKPEFVGHSHLTLGKLVAGCVYEVEDCGEVFEPVPEPPKKAPKAEKES